MPIHKIEAYNLQKSYKARRVVEDVSLEVHSSEVVGLLGPNGAGKTTTFYMIVGLVLSDSGQILFNGNPIEHLSIDKRAKLGIGYLPQEASVFRKLSVEDNLNIALEVRKDLNPEARKEKLDTLIEEFNLEHVRHSLGISLSGGERRRVEIARALAIDPAFILLDEPFAGVDPISVSDIQNIITDLAKRGIGVLITDHNVRETLSICERAYILGEGKILAAGSSEEVLADETVKRVYLGEGFKL